MSVDVATAYWEAVQVGDPTPPWEEPDERRVSVRSTGRSHRPARRTHSPAHRGDLADVVTAVCAQTGTDRRARACLAYADGSCGPCGLQRPAEPERAVYADLYEPYARPVYDTAEDGSLAWLGGLAILLSAALVIVGLPWLIVAVLT